MIDPFFVARPSRRDDLVNLAGARSALNLPLLKDDAVVGAFVIYREEPGVWPDKQVALLESFAAQAVIAMENARLLKRNPADSSLQSLMRVGDYQLHTAQTTARQALQED